MVKIPIHQYVCPVCDNKIEKLVFKDELVFCEKCREAIIMKKTLSTFSFIVNGFSASNGYSKGEKNEA